MNSKAKRRSRGRVLGKLWLPAVVLAVILAVGYGVNLARRSSAAITHPPAEAAILPTVVQINPKNVTYEVFGELSCKTTLQTVIIELRTLADNAIRAAGDLRDNFNANAA